MPIINDRELLILHCKSIFSYNKNFVHAEWILCRHYTVYMLPSTEYMIAAIKQYII